MKVVRLEDVPQERRVHNQRQGTFIYHRLVEGEPRTPGNFLFEIVETTTDFFSPRHRHNFDQFRYQLEGEFDFDRNGRMKPGTLGYFPEGTPYGPQTSSVRSLTLVLQFGGASGNGYMTQRELEAGTAELKKQGVFEKGVFRRNEDVDGKRNVDGYQAVWEFVNRRPMVYPKPRYHDPLMMDPAQFEWIPLDGQPGVAEKPMGVFTERRTEASFLRLDPGATCKLQGRRLYFVIEGAGTAGGKPYARRTTTFCDTGDQADLTATAPTEVLMLGLPKFAAATQQPTASAAE
jgi:hypothetical protein